MYTNLFEHLLALLRLNIYQTINAKGNKQRLIKNEILNNKNPTKTRIELISSGRVGSSCPTGDTRCVTHAKLKVVESTIFISISICSYLISGYIWTVWRQPQDHDHWLIVTLKVFWHTSMKKGDNCVCLLNTPWFYKVDILANAIIVAWKFLYLAMQIYYFI